MVLIYILASSPTKRVIYAHIPTWILATIINTGAPTPGRSNWKRPRPHQTKQKSPREWAHVDTCAISHRKRFKILHRFSRCKNWGSLKELNFLSIRFDLSPKKTLAFTEIILELTEYLQKNGFTSILWRKLLFLYIRFNPSLFFYMIR